MEEVERSYHERGRKVARLVVPLLIKILEEHQNPLIVGIGGDSIPILLAHRHLRERGYGGRVVFLPVSRENEADRFLKRVSDLFRNFPERYRDLIKQALRSSPRRFREHLEKIAETSRDHDAIVVVDAGLRGRHAVPLKLVLESMGVRPVKVGIVNLVREGKLQELVDYYVNEGEKARDENSHIEGFPQLAPEYRGGYLEPAKLEELMRRYTRNSKNWEEFKRGLKEGIEELLDEAGHPRQDGHKDGEG